MQWKDLFGSDSFVFDRTYCKLKAAVSAPQAKVEISVCPSVLFGFVMCFIALGRVALIAWIFVYAIVPPSDFLLVLHRRHKCDRLRSCVLQSG